MSNLHAAVGVSQIKKIEEIRKTRQEACKKYFDELSKLAWIAAPKGDLTLSTHSSTTFES